MRQLLKKSLVIGSVLTLSSILTTSASAADSKKGGEIFGQRCSSCHGVAGAGDGPVAQALPPDQKPRNLQEAKFKFATDDATLKTIIKEGGAAHGLNPLMPPHADLSDVDLDNVIAFVRTLKK